MCALEVRCVDLAEHFADGRPQRAGIDQFSDARQQEMHRQSCLLVDMLGQNNKLTEQVSALMEQNITLTRAVHELTERIETLTVDLRDQLSAART